MLMRPNPTRFNVQSNKMLSGWYRHKGLLAPTRNRHSNRLVSRARYLLGVPKPELDDITTSGDSFQRETDIVRGLSHWRGHLVSVPKLMVSPEATTHFNARLTLGNMLSHWQGRFFEYQSRWQPVWKPMIPPKESTIPMRSRFTPSNHHQPRLCPSRRACTPSAIPRHI